MDIDSTSPSPSSYTLLRIKRKRTEEPLDALVVESESRIRRKKSRGGSAPSGISTPAGVFQFAQTIEHDAWEDVQRQLDLQDQISRLAKKDPSPQSPPPLPTSSSHPTPLTTRSSPAQKAEGSKKRRYTIIPQQQQDLSSIPEYPRYPTSPPKVISHKDLAARNTTPFKLYDAVLSGESSSSKAQISDPEMDKFIPMLNDYLKLHDILPHSPAPPLSRDLPQSTTNPRTHSRTPSADYVWDIFYHRPVSLSEWNEAAKVATLTGLPPSITDPYDSDSDTEPEDEADEDSNEEDYYKNDYPDEDETSDEDSEGSDMFHEHSDHDEMFQNDDDMEHEWR